MKRTLSLMLAMLIVLPAQSATEKAQAAPADGMAAVARLGHLNGQALACRLMDVSARTRNAIVALAPKTREIGDRFESETSRTFLASPPCIERQRLLGEVEAAVLALRQAYPSSRHTEAEAPVSTEIATRYVLMDHDGRTVSDQDFRGRFQLLTFGYTSCPDVCPTTLAEMAAVLKELGEGAGRVQPLFITVDPERDTPALLKDYTRFFDPRILGLSGSPALVRGVADNFKVRYEKISEPGAAPGHYTVDHTAGMYLLAPDGRFLARFPYAMPVRELSRRIGDYLKATP